MDTGSRKSTVLLVGVLLFALLVALAPVGLASAAEPDDAKPRVPTKPAEEPAQDDDIPPRPPIPDPDPDEGDDGGDGDDGGSGSGGGKRTPEAREGNPAIFSELNMVEAPVGSLVQLPLIVTNETGRSNDVMMYTQLPSFLEFDRGTTSWGEFYAEGNMITVDMGPLYDEDVVNINIVARVVAPAASPENVVMAKVDSRSGNDDPEDNETSLTLAVRLPGVGDPGQPDPGQPDPEQPPETEQPEPEQGETPPPDDDAIREGGEGRPLYMSLRSQPRANVIVNFVTDDQINPIESVTFTPDNWNDVQVRQITAVDDGVVEGDHIGTVGFEFISDDPAYNNLQAPSLTIRIIDNDDAGIIIEF